eukprot:366568-Chlamydomonas_euryale.AAC.21
MTTTTRPWVCMDAGYHYKAPQTLCTAPLCRPTAAKCSLNAWQTVWLLPCLKPHAGCSTPR